MSGPTIKSARGRCASLKSSTRFQPLYNRPVSDLKVTYIIFPGTAEKPFGPPDLEKIHARCETLVTEIGGASVPLHKWEILSLLRQLPAQCPVLHRRRA